MIVNEKDWAGNQTNVQKDIAEERCSVKHATRSWISCRATAVRAYSGVQVGDVVPDGACSTLLTILGTAAHAVVGHLEGRRLCLALQRVDIRRR